MIKIGLTGSIGMGKSETAKIFSGLGVPVYDADASVHKLYEAGNKGALAIKDLYPKAISKDCLLYTSPSPRDRTRSRMPSSA